MTQQVSNYLGTCGKQGWWGKVRLQFQYRDKMETDPDSLSATVIYL